MTDVVGSLHNIPRCQITVLRTCNQWRVACQSDLNTITIIITIEIREALSDIDADYIDYMYI